MTRGAWLSQAVPQIEVHYRELDPIRDIVAYGLSLPGQTREGPLQGNPEEIYAEDSGDNLRDLPQTWSSMDSP